MKILPIKGNAEVADVIEEHVPALQSRADSVAVYSKMAKDPQVAMILRAIKNSLKSAVFEWQSEDEEKAEEVKAYLYWCTDKINWPKFMNEVLTMAERGFSCHEIALEYDTFEGAQALRIKGLYFRHQSTIEEVEAEEGVLVSVLQDGNPPVSIPAENLYFISIGSEGNNLAGESLLRPAYGSYIRKSAYLKINAIGLEKAAIGTPMGTTPSSITFDSDEFREFKKILSNFSAAESSFLLMPEGFKVEVFTNKFDSASVLESLRYEDRQIAKSVLFQFLELGQNSVGSYGLSIDQSDFALHSIRFIAKTIAEEFTRVLLPLVTHFFGEDPPSYYMNFSGISDSGTKELADVIATLTREGIIQKDDDLESYIRERYDLPAKMIDQEQGSEPEKESALQKDVRTIKADDVKKKSALDYVFLSEVNQHFDDGSAVLMDVIDNNLLRMVNETHKKFQEDTKEKGLLTAIKKVKVDPKEYEKKLFNAMLDIASKGVMDAELEVARRKEMKAVYSRATKKMDSIGKTVITSLKLQAKKQAQKHAGDIESRFVFTGISGVRADLQEEIVMSEVLESALEYVNSPQIESAAETISSQSYNSGRNDNLFSPKTKNQVYAYLYSAVLDERTTDLCLSLNGKLFRADDEASKQYMPPNHHNCRSFIIPVFEDEEEADREITGLFPDPESEAIRERYAEKNEHVPSAEQIGKGATL